MQCRVENNVVWSHDAEKNDSNSNTLIHIHSVTLNVTENILLNIVQQNVFEIATKNPEACVLYVIP